MLATMIPEYRRPLLLCNGHLETIFPALFRRVRPAIQPVRQRIETSDGDFLDLDWMKKGSQAVVILQHGLEGNSTRPYIVGMANAFYNEGIDVCCWNFRGCGEEINKTLRFYHSGATEDLEAVIQTAGGTYQNIYLVGFSLGGNMTLKYLGEGTADPKVKRAVVFSVPLDLARGADNLHTTRNYFYERRFLQHLKRKVLKKNALMPGKLDVSDLAKVQSIRDFDQYFTSRIHGFTDAEDYYRQCSSRYYLGGIKTPTLIINAKNDPLLTPECWDQAMVKNNPLIRLETPVFGGHVGFSTFNGSGTYWSERRALQFCLDQ